jgi:hypothetical protein
LGLPAGSTAAAAPDGCGTVDGRINRKFVAGLQVSEIIDKVTP